MKLEIRRLVAGDESVLTDVATGVFDDPIVPARAREFFADARHHLIVPTSGREVVGFITAVHYVHPDKTEPELWINELGVAPSHQCQGLGRRSLRNPPGLPHAGNP